MQKLKNRKNVVAKNKALMLENNQIEIKRYGWACVSEIIEVFVGKFTRQRA